MKLMRVGERGRERPALWDGAAARDLSGVVDDLAGQTLGDEGLARIAAVDPATLPVIEGRVGPCVGRVGKIVCIGLNYSDHAAETGQPVPSEPIVFMKATTAIAGPHDDIPLPRGARKTDWEVELGVVIGARARYVGEADAMARVAGYCVVDDISERAHQAERGGQWTKGKSHDGFGPLGPWLVTRDEVADPQALKMWCDVDGERRQDGSTATMVFGVAHLVHYLSQFMTLEPGDVIATGTPPGVGLGMDPPTFLRPGQEVAMGIDGLGEQRARTVAG